MAALVAALSARGSEEERGVPGAAELTGGVFLSLFPRRHRGNPGLCLA